MNRKIFRQIVDNLDPDSHFNVLLNRIIVFPSRAVMGNQGHARVLGFIEHIAPQLYYTSVLLHLSHVEILEVFHEERGAVANTPERGGTGTAALMSIAGTFSNVVATFQAAKLMVNTRYQ
ncbi:hypothetical protein PS15m_011574 [Mucor circinelloides]